MSNRLLIQLASRALSLNIVIWAVAGLAYVPEHMFSVFHYWRITNRTVAQDYYLESDVIVVITHLVLSTALFVAAIWIHKCGPDVEKFLSPTD